MNPEVKGQRKAWEEMLKHLTALDKSYDVDKYKAISEVRLVLYGLKEYCREKLKGVAL